MSRRVPLSESEPASSEAEISAGARLVEQPSPQPWVGRLRYVVVPVVAVLAIAAAIYYLEETPDAFAPEQGQTQAAGGAEMGAARPVQVTAASEELAKTPAPRIGYPAPDFTLNSVDGTPMRLSDFRGRAVFLNFFATWCPPCRAEMPDILATHEEYKTQGATVLAIDLQEEARIVASYADAVGLTFPIVLDRTGRVTALYRITAIPTSFFIDKDGVIRDMQIGAMSKTMMQSRLAKAL